MDSRPTVVHVIGTLAVGGAERVLVRLCRLTEDRCQHKVLTLLDVPGSAPELTSRGIPVERFTRWGSDGILRQLVKSRRRGARSLVLHGWTYPGCVAATMFRALLCPRAALVWDVRNSMNYAQTHSTRGRLSLRIAKRLSPAPHVVNFNSEAGFRVHLGQGWAVRRHTVIHNPIAGATAEAAFQWRNRFRQQLGIDDSTPLVAIVTRDVVYKRLDIAVEAMRIVSTRIHGVVCLHAGRLRPTTRLGDGRSGITGLGELEDPRPLMAAADVLLLTSDVEGFPNVVAEAILLGTPVVSTCVGDAPVIVGDFGRICPPGDPAALADELVDVLSTRLKQQVEAAEAARSRVSALCNPETIADRYVELWSMASRGHIER